MKNIKIIGLSIVVLTTVIVVSGFAASTSSSPSCKKAEVTPVNEVTQKQTMNMFVSHGHCSLPFAGTVENFKVDFGSERTDGGNPLENMKLSFDIDPNSFKACREDHLTARVKTPGLFMDNKDDRITFTSTNVWTMGVDWYQINGKMTIKGVEKDVKFFATGVRDPKNKMPDFIVLEAQFDLLDWGIDYDKIVNGKSDPHPTKWMFMNMTFEMC
jgi:polyisoprenoid-binding protein YceI